MGWRQREAITFPIRPYLEKKGIDFLAQRVTRIDADGNALQLLDGSTLAYDYLVITTGPKLSFDEVPGAGPDGHTRSICTIDHAEQTWSDYQKFLEAPGPAIIGAMPGASRSSNFASRVSLPALAAVLVVVEMFASVYVTASRRTPSATTSATPLYVLTRGSPAVPDHV